MLSARGYGAMTAFPAVGPRRPSKSGGHMGLTRDRCPGYRQGGKTSRKSNLEVEAGKEEGWPLGERDYAELRTIGLIWA